MNLPATIRPVLALLALLPISAPGAGKQVSESGVKHSFLVCGKFTALINEDSEVVWSVPGYG